MIRSRPVPKLAKRWRCLLAGSLALTLLGACTPTVQIAAPSEPITVNLNVKIQHEIYVKVDKDVDKLFDDAGLF